MLRRIALGCGIVSSVLYVAVNVVTVLRDPAYSALDQTVSELSAIGAPTRALWLAFAVPYSLSALAFGAGVLASARESRALRVAGAALLAYGVVCVLWPFAPMHLRPALAAGAADVRDTMHIVFAGLAVALMVVSMVASSVALGPRFRFFSIATLSLLLLFGALTSIQAPGVSAGAATPWIGLWERANIGLFLLWTTALSIVLLRAARRPAATSTATKRVTVFLGSAQPRNTDRAVRLFLDEPIDLPAICWPVLRPTP